MDLDSWDPFLGSRLNLSFGLHTHERFGKDSIQKSHHKDPPTNWVFSKNPLLSIYVYVQHGCWHLQQHILFIYKVFVCHWVWENIAVGLENFNNWYSYLFECGWSVHCRRPSELKNLGNWLYSDSHMTSVHTTYFKLREELMCEMWQQKTLRQKWNGPSMSRWCCPGVGCAERY